LVGRDAEERSEMLSQVPAGKTLREEAEEQQGAEQQLDPCLAGAKSRCSLAVVKERLVKLVERVFTDGTIVADAFDVEETPVGLEADGSQGRKILDQPADAEVVSVVDGGFGAEGPSLLVVLLDVAALVVDVQRGDDPLGDDPVRNRPGVRRVTLRAKMS
jgi:hypothetical protein